jgi:hypothetical protein
MLRINSIPTPPPAHPFPLAILVKERTTPSGKIDCSTPVRPRRNRFCEMVFEPAFSSSKLVGDDVSVISERLTYCLPPNL